MKGINISNLEGNPIKEWIKVFNYRTNRISTVGVMVGCRIEGKNGEKLFNADYAIVHPEYDDFDPKLAVKIAYGRAKSARSRRASKNVIDRECGWDGSGVSLVERFTDFIERCQRYYKDCRPTAKAAAFYCIDSATD